MKLALALLVAACLLGSCFSAPAAKPDPAPKAFPEALAEAFAKAFPIPQEDCCCSEDDGGLLDDILGPILDLLIPGDDCDDDDGLLGDILDIIEHLVQLLVGNRFMRGMFGGCCIKNRIEPVYNTVLNYGQPPPIGEVVEVAYPGRVYG